MVFSAVSFCSNQWNVTNLSLYGKTGTRTPFLVILSPDSITFIFFFGFILFCFVLFCFEFSPSCSCWYIVGFLLRLVNDWLCQRYDFFFFCHQNDSLGRCTSWDLDDYLTLFVFFLVFFFLFLEPINHSGWEVLPRHQRWSTTTSKTTTSILIISRL